MERKYLPSYAELIDRLSIVIQKEMFATEEEMRAAFVKERNDIIHDINVFISEGIRIDGEHIFSAMLLQLVNSHIWENESGIRGDGEKKNYELTHSLNYDRSLVKKHIQEMINGRVDFKLSYSKGAWPINFSKPEAFVRQSIPSMKIFDQNPQRIL